MLTSLREAIGDKILLPDAVDQPRNTDGTWRWMWFFSKPYSGVIFVTIILRLIRNTSYALITYFFSLLIDALQSGRAFADPHQMWVGIAKVSVFYIVVMLGYMLLYFEIVVLDKAQRGLTLYGISHLLGLSLDWHEQQGSGAKLQRVMQARENFRQMYFLLARNGLGFVGEIAGIVIALTAMKIPFYMVGLFAGYIVTYIAIFLVMNRPIDALQNRHSQLKEFLVSRIYDFVSLIRVTKIFQLYDYVMTRSYRAEKDAFHVMNKIRFIGITRWTVINMDVWLWGVTIVAVGLHMVFAKEITIGAFSGVIFLYYRLWGTLEDVVVAQNEYYDAKSGFLRIRDTLSVPIQNYDIAPLVTMSPQWDAIICKDLAFAYDENKPVLKKIDLAIPRGKHVALIGRSGAGKSTLIKLLMKQNLPNAGQIMVGNADLKHVPGKDWLQNLALVPQDVELINSTLRENVLLGQTDIDEEFYRDCLRKAYLEDFVMSLPNGDLTEIGERGVKLSGGQKQRLGIARALARRAEIIIFDEATSSLDSESEAHIQHAMHQSFSDKTVVMIAHRLSTIREADLIYVLDQGLVAEAGSFSELEAKGGIFAKLWAMQSGGFLPV